MRIALIRMKHDELAVYPPLGLLYISSFLKRHRQDEVKIFDNRLLKLDLDEFTRLLSEWSPDIVGISMLSIEDGNLYNYASHIKKAIPACRIVVGGPHSLCNFSIDIQDKNIDAIVVGEGEGSFLETVNHIGCYGSLDEAQIKGVAVRDGKGNVVYPGDREPMDIHQLPLPDYESIDFEPYFRVLKNSHNVIQLNKRNMNVISSRGCPFACSYCLNPFGRKYRMRKPVDFVNELIYLKNKYNILDINIEDDAFNVSIKRAKIIFKLIIDANLNLNIAFPNGVRADRIDEELIILMKKAGVYRIAFGIESASAKNLQLIQKHLNLETVTDSIELATRHNINTHGFFILGFPDETEEEMQQTVDYALKSRLCTAHFALLKIFKGTELYRHAVLKYGLSTELPTLAGGSYTRVNENFSKVPADRIYHIRKVAYIRFLCSPSRIYRVFNTLPQKKYLFVQAYNFFKKIIFPPK